MIHFKFQFFINEIVKNLFKIGQICQHYDECRMNDTFDTTSSIRIRQNITKSGTEPRERCAERGSEDTLLLYGNS
jgi:hypothetical protein